MEGSQGAWWRFKRDAEVAPGDRALARKVGLAVLVITGIYLALGFPWFFDLLFQDHLSAVAWGIGRHLYNWACATLLFLVVPLLLCRRWGISRAEIGMQKGRWKWGLLLVVLGSLVVLAIPANFLNDPSLTAEYPLARPLVEPQYGPFRWWALLLWEVGYILIYYIPYETFWRGFALRPLYTRGRVNALYVILFTTALTTLIHWPKPPSEIIAAAAVGFIYGYLALKLDSYYYGLVNHVEVGITGDVTSTLLILGLI